MAVDLRALALEKAAVLSNRVKDLLSSGQDYIRDQFGVDLGLKPELYPTWVVLSTAAAGLLLLLGLSWAAVCGGLLAGKRRGSPVARASSGGSEPAKAPCSKTAKPEEQKKRNKKKSVEKKAQSNGRPATGPQEEAKDIEAVSKPSPEIKTEKVHMVQAPVQVKKNKKKAKADVKPAQSVSTIGGKEPDDGAWETKVSNREKRQQRRKDKGPEDSGSPGGVAVPKIPLEPPIAPAPTNARRNRATWSGIDGRMKTDLKPVSFSMLGRNITEPMSQCIDGQRDGHPDVEDEWSGFNGMAAVDTSSDWNAPIEHWGNYEEAPVLVTPAAPPKDQPAPNKLSEDEKEIDDAAEGAAKSKRKKKKKKKAEEEAAPVAQMVTSLPLVSTIPKSQELPPAVASTKSSANIPSSQKKSEPVAEPPKPSQKKKVRRET
ncbi:metadherin a [Diretmus argenteus]